MPAVSAVRAYSCSGPDVIDRAKGVASPIDFHREMYEPPSVTTVRMHADEISVDIELVARLIAVQYPNWSHLALRPVEPWGTDNAIWRLGEDLVVRLPRIYWAKRTTGEGSQVAPEARLAPLGVDTRTGGTGATGQRVPLPLVDRRALLEEARRARRADEV